MEKAIPGPSNVREAKDYKTKLNGLFDNFMEMLRKDNKYALEITIQAIKKHIQGTWTDMTRTQVDVAILTIKDPSCTLLRQSLDQEPVSTSDPNEELPMGKDVLKMLPQAQSQAVKEDCINLFKISA